MCVLCMRDAGGSKCSDPSLITLVTVETQAGKMKDQLAVLCSRLKAQTIQGG
jgi:hypothetical protein